MQSIPFSQKQFIHTFLTDEMCVDQTPKNAQIKKTEKSVHVNTENGCRPTLAFKPRQTQLEKDVHANPKNVCRSTLSNKPR